MKTRNRQTKKAHSSGGVSLRQKDVFVLSFGAMLGWSWVVLSGDWILSAGVFGTLLALLLGGIFVLFVGIVYAELTAAMPESGGILLFGKRAFGRNTAFLGTWFVTLGFLSVICFESVALPNVIAYLFPQYPSGFLYSISGFDIYASWLAVGMASSLLIMILNYRGAKTATAVQTLLTLLIVIIGLAFFIATIASGNLETCTFQLRNGINGTLSVLVMMPFVLCGFDVIPHMAGETSMPAKRIGQMLILSVVAAVIWYMMISLCVGSALDESEIAGSLLPTADAMGRVFGGSKFASNLLVAGGIAGILACWNAFYMGASRSIYTLAQEGFLPAAFAKIHPKHETPGNAILLVGALSTIAPLFGKNMLTWMVNAGSFGTVIAYLVTALCFLRLRKREPDLPRPYAVRKWRLVGGLAVTMCIGMLFLYMPGCPSALLWPYEWAIVLLWVMLGALLLGAKKLEAMKLHAIVKRRQNSLFAQNDENKMGEC